MHCKVANDNASVQWQDNVDLQCVCWSVSRCDAHLLHKHIQWFTVIGNNRCFARILQTDSIFASSLIRGERFSYKVFRGADGSNKFGAAGLKGAQDTLVTELAAQMSAAAATDATTSSRLASSGSASSAAVHPSAAPETSGGDAAAAGVEYASSGRPSAGSEVGAGSLVSHGSMDPGCALPPPRP